MDNIFVHYLKVFNWTGFQRFDWMSKISIDKFFEGLIDEEKRLMMDLTHGFWSDLLFTK